MDKWTFCQVKPNPHVNDFNSYSSNFTLKFFKVDLSESFCMYQVTRYISKSGHVPGLCAIILTPLLSGRKSTQISPLKNKQKKLKNENQICTHLSLNEIIRFSTDKKKRLSWKFCLTSEYYLKRILWKLIHQSR